MVEYPGPNNDAELHERNRLAGRVADAEIARRHLAKHLWGATAKEEPKMREAYQRASDRLDDAALAYAEFLSRMGDGFTVITPGEPHNPEDWPA